jgi:hypothetical protein
MSEPILEFPNFDELVVSTKTYTALPNFKINLDELDKMLHVETYEFEKKRRGRKPKNYVEPPPIIIPFGTFIFLDYNGKTRGRRLNFKKPKNNKHSFMKNAMSIDVYFDKCINFKIYCNGTFQITGSKTYKHVILCIRAIWDVIKDKPDMYTIPPNERPQAIIVQAMRNVDFKLGFKVDREKMIKEKSMFKDAKCHLDVNCTYTGVTIKIPLEKDIKTMETVVLTYNEDEEWETSKGTYDEYLNKLSPKSRSDKLKKKHHNTFFVFYSGSTVMTGPSREFMRDDYYMFIDLIRSNYNHIVENLKPAEVLSDGDIFSDDDEIVIL